MSTNLQITVLGLGTGDEDQLTLGVWKKLQVAAKEQAVLYLRTLDHPMVQMLDTNQIPYQTFDENYLAHQTFEQVYESIAEALIQSAKTQSSEVIYAVPGHPMVAEYTVQLLKQRCPSEGISLQIIGGESFLDQGVSTFWF
ncbi:uncharacterized protein YabN with tetrapyrrole methylase and pyrophosphatase domain [Paenibacillus sp. V4I5]|nr:uncharacterized protein YabN with tetrapyrrole methylase and pyrophosphatase domain [Paenibacillus sp. V4I5]